MTASSIEPDRRGTRDLPFSIGSDAWAAGRSFAALVALHDALRSPGGCPWDAEQTHVSLGRHLLEEAYEVLDVLDSMPAGSPDSGPNPEVELYGLLCEELGDLLMQVVFHARLASEVRAFSIIDVIDGIVDKLVERHPHVFAGAVVVDADGVVDAWEKRKHVSKPRASVLDDIPSGLPALSRAAKMRSRTKSIGLDWSDAAELRLRVDTALDRFDSGANPEVVGEALFYLAALAKLEGEDPETSLRRYLHVWEDQFRHAERPSMRGQSPFGLSG